MITVMAMKELFTQTYYYCKKKLKSSKKTNIVKTRINLIY